MVRVKMADTEMIRRINATPGNRRIDDEGMARLDPDGVHILDPVMVHNNVDMRCWGYFKMRGQDEPENLMLDVPMQEYEALPDTETS